jgi:hypothetical protein
LRGIFIF